VEAGTEVRTSAEQTREVYLAGTRIYLASVVAQVCAALLFVGVIGAIVTWGKHSAIFDFANSPHGTSKAELGYLFGPALILILLPLIRRRPPHVAYTRRYRERLAAAVLLWIVGLALLLDHLAGLDSEYSLQLGAYVAPALIVGGLVASLAMWPLGLSTGQLDRRGDVVPAASGAGE